MIQMLAIANYRSLRQLVVPPGRLTVITGANGNGRRGKQ
jgi:predicted ATPase